MAGGAPHYCRAESYDLFAAQISRIETVPALTAAAVAIAMHESPGSAAAALAAVNARLDGLARTIHDRLRTADPQATLAHAHELLFEEEGFTGDLDNYYDPRNSYLPAVLATRRGLPITLSLVYRCVMERLDMQVVGINAPLHFMAAVHIDDTMMIVDPFFAGRVLSRPEAIEHIAHALQRPVSDAEDLLPVATHRQWLARMLHNLINVFTAMHRQNDVAAMMELAGLLETAT